MADGPPPPPPPPHGQNPRPPGGLPDGNYDIFIIPPHSSGGGFLYLPSLQPHRNSFIAGIFVALIAVGIYIIVMPVLSAWFQGVMAGSGAGFLLLVGCVGLGAWALGKTSAETSSENGTGGGSASGKSRTGSAGPPPNAYAQPPPGNEQFPPPPPRQENYAPPPPKSAPAQSGWEKAREETKKRAEEAKRAEDLRKKREAAQKMREEQQKAKEEAEAAAQKAKEEAEKQAKAAADKIKWEQQRARQREELLRAAREKTEKEKAEKEKEAREKDTREREARERSDKAKAEREAAVRERLEKMKAQRAASSSVSDLGGKTSPTKTYVKPTAKSYTGTEEYSARPYDTPSPSKSRHTAYKSSASSISGLSESSYAPSMSTARTTPPPSYRGPYSTNDPGKIQIKGVYLFSDSFPNKPVQQLVAGERPCTDGLILKIETAGLFIDDDVRGVAQREWDVKAWTLKNVEDGGMAKSGGHLHVFRASVKDGENKRYVFVMESKESHKIKIGLEKLKQGSQLKKLDSSSMKESEVKGVLSNLGWI